MNDEDENEPDNEYTLFVKVMAGIFVAILVFTFVVGYFAGKFS